MTSTTPNKTNLLRDEGGAIMIMGLAMILGLIAFLWFMLGIGETLAFRDHMQDAADAAAFTQSAVSALGMNLIVVINMILLLMVAIYVGYSVVITIKWASSVVCCPTPAFLSCCPRIPGYISSWNSRNSFAAKEAKVEGLLSEAQSGIALALPLVGTGFSYFVQSDYKMSSMTSGPYGAALSPMNFPGTFSLTKTGARYGLPVAHEHLTEDCMHLFDAVTGLITGLGLPSAVNKVIGYIGGAIGEAVQWYYCSDKLIPGTDANTNSISAGTNSTSSTDSNGNTTTTGYPPSGFPPSDTGSSGSSGSITNGLSAGLPGIERLLTGGGDAGNYWEKEGYGPMTNFNHKEPTGLIEGANPSDDRHKAEYKNGADYMQSYGIVLVPSSYSDHHATHNIALMQLDKGKWQQNDAETTGTVLGYYAQSELYFDCNDVWASDDCDNNGGIDRMDMTMYRFEWRARLVKFHLSGGIGKAFDFVSQGLGGISSVRQFINGAGADEFTQALQYIDQVTGLNIIGMIGSIADIFPGTPAH